MGMTPKQLHHLLRVEEYIERYINGENYENCLLPKDTKYLIEVKKGKFNLDEARILANDAKIHIDEMTHKFLENCNSEPNEDIENLLNQVQYDIVLKCLKDKLQGEMTINYGI